MQDVLDEQPDMNLLKALGKRTAITTTDMDVVITTKADEHYDCVSRYFAPVAGIEEDPVTGSIHTAIAPLWAEKLSKNNIVAYQASSRGGILYCNILNQERIEIAGYGKLYMQAEIFFKIKSRLNKRLSFQNFTINVSLNYLLYSYNY